MHDAVQRAEEAIHVEVQELLDTFDCHHFYLDMGTNIEYKSASSTSSTSIQRHSYTKCLTLLLERRTVVRSAQLVLSLIRHISNGMASQGALWSWSWGTCDKRSCRLKH